MDVLGNREVLLQSAATILASLIARERGALTKEWLQKQYFEAATHALELQRAVNAVMHQE
jgi:hypothetical protein